MGPLSLGRVPRGGAAGLYVSRHANSPYNLLADRVSDVFRFAGLGRSRAIPCLDLRPSSDRHPPRRSSGPDLRSRSARPPVLDPLLPANQDRLTDDVWLTRNDFKGLLNAALDCDAFSCTYSDNSPMGTEWATELQNSGASHCRHELGRAQFRRLGGRLWRPRSPTQQHHQFSRRCASNCRRRLPGFEVYAVGRP